MHGLAEPCEYNQHRKVTHELQRKCRANGGVDDDFVRKRDLSYQSRVAGKAHRRSLQTFLRGKPRPQRDRDEQQKALAAHASCAEHRCEYEVVDGQ